jgi:aminoglycoside phosphotransferase (APT) family kinase protein
LVRWGLSVREMYCSMFRGRLDAASDNRFSSSSACLASTSKTATGGPPRRRSAKRSPGCLASSAGAPGVWRRPANVGGRLQRNAQRLLHHYRQLGLPESSKIEGWLGGLPKGAWRHNPRLCHQDVSANNVLIECQARPPRIGLVDLAELSYSSAAYELGRLRVKLFPSDDSAWRVCREAYLAAADVSLREEIDRTWRVGILLACLHYAVFTPFAEARRERLADIEAIIAQ